MKKENISVTVLGILLITFAILMGILLSSCKKEQHLQPPLPQIVWFTAKEVDYDGYYMLFDNIKVIVKD